MVVNRNELITALKRAMPGVDAGNVILEGADTFIFDNGFIHSFNDNISVSIPFPMQNKQKENVSCSIKAKDFYDLLNRYKDDVLKIIMKSDTWVIKTENSVAELTLLKNSISQSIKDMFAHKMKWKDLPGNFIEGLSICKFSANKSILSGAFVSDDFIVSTDEIRFNYYKLSESITESFWITDNAITELCKLNNPKQYSISQSWIHFLTEQGDIFSCKRLSQDKYPINKIKKLIEEHAQEKTDISNVLPDSLMDAINRAAALSQNIESFSTVKLTFSEEGIEVFSQRPSGKYTENIAWAKPLKKLGDPISIYIDFAMVENGMKYSKSFYLKKILAGDSERIRIIFTNPNGIQLISTFDPGE